MILSVPSDDGRNFPSLGPQVVEWMEEHLVFGPGDLRGEPLRLDQEQQAFIWRMYELFPKGHPQEGRRRFPRCALSLAKGLRKTELAAFIAAAELHPDAPVRFNGWKGKKLAPGKGVTDPLVIMVATSEGQSDDGAYAALKSILEDGPLAKDFDIGLERIIRLDGAGKAVSVAGSPNARDGARTTFQIFDETHRQTSERNRQAHQTMMANMPKRKIADTWALEITTAPEPGAGSIAEATMDYAQAIADGDIADAGLFFYHRQASDHHDLTTEAGARAAVIEASGPAAAWRDIEKVITQWKDPNTDRTYWERVWCNRLVKGGTQAFDIIIWKSLAVPARTLRPGALITLGFDGAEFHDSTGLVGTEVESGFQEKLGLWERPASWAPERKWKVPVEEVDACVRGAFQKFRVYRMYADPPYWQSMISVWMGAFGEEKVIEWQTNRRRQMTVALEGFETAMKGGLIPHADDADFERHLGNARRRDIPMSDETGQPMWLISKERRDSPHKIDLAMAAILSWEARADAIAAGALKEPEFQMMTFVRTKR